MNPTNFLSLDEVLQCVKDLRRRCRRWDSPKLNLAVFRLSCCCGLRRAEISQLRLRDVLLAGSRPCLRVRADTAKGRRAVIVDGKTVVRDKRKSHVVPLWWDRNTLADLRQWAEYRRTLPGTDGGPCTPDSLFLAGVDERNRGGVVSPNKMADRWKTAIRILGPERRRQVSIHGGRHTFASLSLANGRSLVEVKEALGHSNLATTSIYLHCIEQEGLPDVFAARG